MIEALVWIYMLALASSSPGGISTRMSVALSERKHDIATTPIGQDLQTAPTYSVSRASITHEFSPILFHVFRLANYNPSGDAAGPGKHRYFL